LGSNPHRHCSVPPRRNDVVDSLFAWFLSGQTCPRMGGFVAATVVVFLTICSYYAYTRHYRTVSGNAAGSSVDSAVLQQSTDPQALLNSANHFYWLNNGPAATPLYARAEKLFSERGDSRNELYGKVGRLRSEAETMSFVDLSRFLNEQLQNPIVQTDKRLRLWCLIAKGYTDIEIVYRATKRDWLEAQEIANELGEKQWATRASGELGLVAFLEGSPGRAARLLGGALLSTMASGDTGGQIRFLELIGRGFEVSGPVIKGAILAGSGRSQWSTRESPRSTETQ